VRYVTPAAWIAGRDRSFTAGAHEKRAAVLGVPAHGACAPPGYSVPAIDTAMFVNVLIVSSRNVAFQVSAAVGLLLVSVFKTKSPERLRGPGLYGA